MKWGNKYLIILLLIIILINLAFISYLFFYSSNKYFLTNFRNRLPFFKASFIIDDLDFLNLNNNPIIINPGDNKLQSLGTAVILAYPDGNLSFNSKSKLYSLPIKIKYLNTFINTNLVLGVSNQKINIKPAKNGLVNEGQEWNNIKLSLLGKTVNFKNKYPLVVSIFYDDEIYDSLINNKNCNIKCKKDFILYQKYSKNLSMLLNNAKNNKLIDKNLSIGPTQFIIYYEN